VISNNVNNRNNNNRNNNNQNNNNQFNQAESNVDAVQMAMGGKRRRKRGEKNEMLGTPPDDKWSRLVWSLSEIMV
jgi:hypothetical protein